jgi:SAM-dependent methyltransferase
LGVGAVLLFPSLGGFLFGYDIGATSSLIYSLGNIELFDVITISNVIEHVHDPRKLISDSANLLNSGGKILILTQNSDAPGLKKWGNKWTTLDTPRHISMFSIDSLNYLESQFCQLTFELKPRGWHLFHTDKRSAEIQYSNHGAQTRSLKLIWHFKELLSHYQPRHSDELFIEITKK